MHSAELAADWVVGAAGAYALLGIVVGLVFVFRAGRTLAGGAVLTPGARLLILPASMLLWPLLTWRSLRRNRA